VAGRPLRPATHRRLGEPLPHQLANGTRAPPLAPTFMKRSALGTGSKDLVSSSGISPPFGRLFRTQGQVTHVLLTRSPLYRGSCDPFLVRLACVRHAASVRSEPGSNSPSKVEPLTGHRPRSDAWSCYAGAENSDWTDALFSFQRAGFREAGSVREGQLACQAPARPRQFPRAGPHTGIAKPPSHQRFPRSRVRDESGGLIGVPRLV
jgi:hypothetical protein